MNQKSPDKPTHDEYESDDEELAVVDMEHKKSRKIYFRLYGKNTKLKRKLSLKLSLHFPTHPEQKEKENSTTIYLHDSIIFSRWIYRKWSALNSEFIF
jgi:hypothetical protein